ncbi:B-cell receptor CD22-like [Chrysemys picta bellii]|uniref:B-cell receptor CD22-like n=1 Tax=Chrysemys picta bellii TaxID=8478 RepID=UPI0032B1378F
MEALLLLALSILTGAGSQDWGVTLPADPLAGWSGSCVTIPCSYTYPEGQLVKAVTWSRNKETIVQLRTAAGQGYDKAERAQFLGDLQHNCTLSLNPLALSDGGAYSFEFQSQSQSWRSPRAVCLMVSGNPRLLLQKRFTNNPAWPRVALCVAAPQMPCPRGGYTSAPIEPSPRMVAVNLS